MLWSVTCLNSPVMQNHLAPIKEYAKEKHKRIIRALDNICLSKSVFFDTLIALTETAQKCHYFSRKHVNYSIEKLIKKIFELCGERPSIEGKQPLVFYKFAHELMCYGNLLAYKQIVNHPKIINEKPSYFSSETHWAFIFAECLEKKLFTVAARIKQIFSDKLAFSIDSINRKALNTKIICLLEKRKYTKCNILVTEFAHQLNVLGFDWSAIYKNIKLEINILEIIVRTKIAMKRKFNVKQIKIFAPLYKVLACELDIEYQKNMAEIYKLAINIKFL